ncbi:amidohydrolase [Streptomyces sp. SM14]|uniref:amidohydrolase n=1 Tax=Streptomyces sp. SM14 TaxID=1736045 RepID=UPI000CD51C12|nr:amidohydrolase [Streptomyces sp. SM14]
MELPPPAGLVDHYSHPVVHGELGLGTFERRLATAVTGSDAGTSRAGSFFDSVTGLALLRWCPPLLGLEPHASPARYLARRRELGGYAATRALLRGSGISDLLVDVAAGAPAWPGEPASVAELASAASGRAHELVDLDQLAAQVAATSGSVLAHLRNLDAALESTARSAAAFTCAGAPLAAEPSATGPPGPVEVARAASATLRGRGGAQTAALRHHLFRQALETGRPVQLRCGDPAPLAPLLGAVAGHGTVVLLPEGGRRHCRTAAELAAVHGHVYADTGPDPTPVLGLAPFGKLMFSTRARLLPELHVVRARQFGRAMERALGAWVAEGECTAATARRIAARIGGGTARAVYRLEVPVG